MGLPPRQETPRVPRARRLVGLVAHPERAAGPGGEGCLPAPTTVALVDLVTGETGNRT